MTRYAVGFYFCAILTIPGVVSAAGATYYVSPLGNDSASGLSSGEPLRTIQRGVDLAGPGDTVALAAGEYREDIVSRRAGVSGAPITITGPAEAVVRGGGNPRVVEVNHSYVTMNGFTVDGLFGSPTSKAGYRDKLVYVLGKEALVGLAGVKVTNMNIRNAGGECVRFRYYIHDAEIAGNTIGPCGIFDFKFNDGGKNGEGIYLGTAVDQWGDGKNPESGPDKTTRVTVHHNTFNTQGNECVDIKEGATGNIVEHNTCRGQKDTESGGFDSRGDANVFRYNSVEGSAGAGVRLGGHTVAGRTYGVMNDVYENTLVDNAAGGIRFQVTPQGKICGNTITGGGAPAVGTFAPQFDPTRLCEGSGGTTPPPPPPPSGSGSLFTSARLVAHSGNFSSGYGPEKLWDGCYEGATYRSTICTAGSRDSSQVWMEFDLGALYTLSRVRLFGDAEGSWVSGSWTLRARRTTGEVWAAAFTNAPALQNNWITKSLDVTARYLRVELQGGKQGRTQARELEAYGTLTSLTQNIPPEPSSVSPQVAGVASVVAAPSASGGGAGGGGGQGSPAMSPEALLSSLRVRLALLQSQLVSRERCTFARPLALGAVGEDVRCLQRFLNSTGFPVALSGAGASGQETTRFGPLTARAVQAWQEANAAAVLTPLGLTRSTGYWGSFSIARYRALP